MELDVAIWSSWRQMACIDSNPNQAYVAGGTILNAFWRTLCHDCSLENAKGPLRRATADDKLIHDEWWWNWIVIQYSKSVEEKTELGSPNLYSKRSEKRSKARYELFNPRVIFDC